MTTTGIYSIPEEKCATCAYWSGEREIVMVNCKLHYVKADAEQYQSIV